MANDNSKLTHHGVDEAVKRTFPNDTLKLLIERSSCRSFHDKKIPPDILETILEAGTHAATGGNLQPYSIIKIEEPEAKKKLAHLNEDQDFIFTAPVNLLFCIDFWRLKRWAYLEKGPFTATQAFRHFWISFQDTIIAAQSICTAADAMGLGSVYIGTVLECFREIREMFELPEAVFPVVLLSLGYPKVRPQPKRKLAVNVIVHNEKYRQMADTELLRSFEDKYPGWKKEITPERMETIEQVCREAHGKKHAAACLARIKEQGFINAIQNYFGLHYLANFMPMRNDDFLKIIEESGFAWFKKFSTGADGTES